VSPDPARSLRRRPKDYGPTLQTRLEETKVFATALAQLRFALSVGSGRPFSAWSLDRLIDSVIDTKREFGTLGDEGAAILGGPTLDDETRRKLQLRRFRTQAARGAREPAYYGRLFSELDLDPSRLGIEDVARVPPTPKEALRGNPDAFVRGTATPCLRTTTTGTTGKPTSVCFSAYEMRTYVALNAISFLIAGGIDEGDIVQINASSRATLGNICFAGACARVGALVYSIGLIEPARTLEFLTEVRHILGKKSRVSYINTYPPYLGELVEEVLRSGYCSTDFGLERIGVGGKLVSEGLKTRAGRLFGAVGFDEDYGMTETWPLAGQPRSEGHLHYEPTVALVKASWCCLGGGWWSERCHGSTSKGE
jgi:phenylacetate-CoA ligase